MHIAIQAVDGQLFRSDEFDLGSSGLDPVEFEHEMAGVVELLENWRGMDNLSLEINGRTRYFNPVNLLWAEVVY